MTTTETATPTQTTILHVGGLHWATSARGIEHTLTARPGVLGVEANALSQTATVTFDPTLTSLDDLQTWIRESATTARASPSRHTCALPPSSWPSRAAIRATALTLPATRSPAHHRRSLPCSSRTMVSMPVTPPR